MKSSPAAVEAPATTNTRTTSALRFDRRSAPSESNIFIPASLTLSGDPNAHARIANQGTTVRVGRLHASYFAGLADT